MGHKIIINVEAKELFIPDCVRLQVNKTYQDTIDRDKEYFGESQLTVSFTNICSKQFDLSEIVLFENNDNGGNFMAKTEPFSIGASQTVNIPIKYFGMCRSNTPVKNYLISFNKTSVPFKLNITQPVITHPPVIQSIHKELPNRENYTFKLKDFTDVYSDIDGHELSSILLEGDLSSFRLNGETINGYAEVSSYQINNGGLIYIAQDNNNTSKTTVSIKAKDSSGEISLSSSSLRITNKAKCIAPTLVSVKQTDHESIEFVWNNNGMEYDNSKSTLTLEVSINGGLSYSELTQTKPVSKTQKTLTETSETVNIMTYTNREQLWGFPANDSLFKFRISINSGLCGKLTSEDFDLIWKMIPFSEIRIIKNSASNFSATEASDTMDYVTTLGTIDRGRIIKRERERKHESSEEWITETINVGFMSVTNLPFGTTEIKYKLTDVDNNQVYSNTLKYTRLELNKELPHCFLGEYEIENPEQTGSITYIDQYGEEQTQVFSVNPSNANQTHSIYYKRIITTSNLISKLDHSKFYTAPPFIADNHKVRVVSTEGSGLFSYINTDILQRNMLVDTTGIEITSINKALVSTKNVKVILVE